MAVPPEFIEDLRQRIPLSDVIGKRVKLIRKGRRFTGLCPFHSEKTPSFRWLMMMASITVLAAVCMAMPFHSCARQMASISWRRLNGLPIWPAFRAAQHAAGPGQAAAAKAALDILETTARFFQDALRRDDGEAAARYIRSRGLAAETISTYRLGYATRRVAGGACGAGVQRCRHAGRWGDLQI